MTQGWCGIIMLGLVVSLSGCSWIKSGTNYVYKLGDKLPTYSGKKCDGKYFCSGKDPAPEAQPHVRNSIPTPNRPPAPAGQRQFWQSPPAGTVPPPPPGQPRFAPPPPFAAPTTQARRRPAGNHVGTPPSVVSPRLARPVPAPVPPSPPSPVVAQQPWTPPSSFDPAGIKGTDEYRAVQQEVQSGVYAPAVPLNAPAPRKSAIKGPSADELFNQIRAEQGLAPLDAAPPPPSSNPALPSLPNVPKSVGYQPPPDFFDGLDESPYNEIIRSIDELPE